MINTIKRALLVSAVLFSSLHTCFSQEKDNNNSTVVFYIVRHGETLLNALDRVQGWSDAPLTPEGKKGAKALGIGLKGIHFASVYTSDLGRARETTQTIVDAKNEKDAQLVASTALRESCFGSYEGDHNKKMWNDIALYLHYTSAVALFADMRKTNKLTDALDAVKKLDTLHLAENFEDVRTRTQNWLRAIAERTTKSGGGNVLVVSHGLAINAMLSNISETHPAAKPLANASVCKVVFEQGKFSIVSFGDTSYMEKGKQAMEQ